MKGWFGTVVLLAALVVAFALSWRGLPEQAPRAAAEIPRAAPAQRKAPPRKAQAPAQKPAASAVFGGYPCASADCADDKAGYQWAQSKVISDPDSCIGRTAGFIEGCRVYVERNRGRLG
jgi:hypothetical protein